MQTEIVEYKDDNLDVKLTISGPPTVEMGMVRTFLVNRMQQEAREGKNGSSPAGEDIMQLAVSFLRTVYYPSFVAAVIEQEGFDHWPISFDEYRSLPEDLGMQWEQAVMRRNPQWFKQIQESTEATPEEKKEAQKKATST